MIGFNTLDGIVLVDFVGWYIRMHECAPYGNPMKLVTSNDKSAPSCTSLWFKPWQDVYDDGKSEDFQDEKEGTSIQSAKYEILKTENRSLRLLLKAQYIRKMINNDKDSELYELKSLIADLDDLMMIAAESNQELRN